jgi:hypothetical protein
MALGCAGCRSKLPAAAERPSVSSGTVQFQGFNVAVALSEKARKRLVDAKETVIVAAYFTGNPKPGAPKQYLSEIGEVDLGHEEVEVAPGTGATFGEIKLKKDALDEVDDQGAQLLVNVYSGKKSSADNLIECGIYEGALRAAQNKSIPIGCKLIGE